MCGSCTEYCHRTVSDVDERRLRPRQEPVDGAARDEAGEHAGADGEARVYRRHAQHDVQIVTRSVVEEALQVVRGVGHAGPRLHKRIAEVRAHWRGRDRTGREQAIRPFSSCTPSG